ncbi:ABC transporter permease [[Clostridium] polysaccharolyticum]|uniref:ABC-2 family transporter protein n=1 Tax=[Clostridium] polysaccharolyticum TaxID=29364 RepID=A0A1H9ZVE9_9FIRM|nr:ABC transporter permease [[Clostridium] polysaccharolyticum]SES85353.1 ABC-2 family transporter protein [[Clostridium] polysaccharolyticum]
MLSLGHIGAIIDKQIKDVSKNLQVLILFFVFPVIAVILTQSVSKDVSEYLVMIFATMHCVFTPLVTTASFISEEKEKNTLRVLIMSGVRPFEYFFSIAIFVLLSNMLTGTVFIFLSDFTTNQIISFYVAALAGGIISVLIGMCIGTKSKSASAANGVAVPLAMVFSFLPMLVSFNKSLEKVAKFLYGQQVSYIVNGQQMKIENVVILAVNFVVCIVAYVVLYQRSRIDE